MVIASRHPFSYAMLASGLLHVGLLVFVVVTNFTGHSQAPVEVSLIGQFVQNPLVNRDPFPKVEVKKAVRKVAPAVAPAPEPEALPDANQVKQEVAVSPAATASESKVTETAESVPQGGGFSQAQYDEYTREVLRMIHSKKVYPRMAQKMGHTGKVLVRLRVGRDGSVLVSEVVEESRFSTLNSAARKLLEEVRKMKPFPDDVREKFWVFNIPIEYKM